MKIQKQTPVFLALMAVLSLVVALMGHGGGAVAAADPIPPEESFKPGELLVRFNPGVNAAAADDLLLRHNASRLETLYNSDIELWQVPAGDELSIAAQLDGEPSIDFSEPNYVYQALDTVPNDPYFNSQWAHANMHSAAAWDLGTGSSSFIIAVIDSGVDQSHPDLAGKLVAGYDFYDNDSNPHDTNGHGTHVSGIAAAMTNNSVGVAGMDWQARIMPLRVLRSDGLGYSSDITSAIYWAYSHGAKVLNLSLGGTSYSTSMQAAVNAAHNAGSLVVAAMGNWYSSGNPIVYPAAYDNVMAVAATTRTDTRAYYSQTGNHCDISAPGGDSRYLHTNGVRSTLPTYTGFYLHTAYGYSTHYDYLQGTSQATPYVAGLATLVWSLSPGMSPDQVQWTIQNTADDLGAAGWDTTFGHGRINAQAAMCSLFTPGAPTLQPIVNHDGNGSYTVDWDPVASATGYTLQEDDNEGFSSPATVYNGANTAFPVSGKGPGVWYYRVRANSPCGQSGWSLVKSAGVVPNAPNLNVISNPGNDDAYPVSWPAVSGANGYVLVEANNAGFNNAIVRYAGQALLYNVTGQSDGTWYYRVSAYNMAGNSGWSSSRSATVSPHALTAPNLLQINNNDHNGAYLVDWSNVAGATSYVLEESENALFDNPTQIYSGANSQHSVTGRPNGTYYYRARAFDASDSSPWSNTRWAVVGEWVYLPVISKN